MKRFEEKVAIVTGAANGIGAATAQRFLNEGAHVCGVDLSFDGNDEWMMQVGADVTQDGDWERIVERVVDVYGRVDILINCAGISGPLGAFEDVTLAQFEKVMAVNVTSIFLGMKAVLPTMKAQKSGAIVNVSSISGERGNPRVAPYVTSKHAVNGLSKSAALAFVEHGIRVNVVSPAPVDTAMMRQAEASAAQRLNLDAEKAHQMMTAGLVMGRYGQAEEIAATITFLCSDDASFMNGAIVAVDGGALAR